MNELKLNWSLLDAFPWLQKWSDRVAHESFLAGGTEWDDIILRPIPEVTSEDLERFQRALEEAPINLEFHELFRYVPSSWQIDDLKLSVRSRNCLRREGIEVFEDLAGMRLADLENVRNLGVGSRVEIFGILFKQNISFALAAWSTGQNTARDLIDDSRISAANIHEILERAKIQNQLFAALEVIASWKEVSSGTRGFELLDLQVSQIDHTAQASLISAFAEIESSLSQIEQSLPTLFSAFSGLDIAAQDVIARRICASEKLSLQELGDEHSVSRERIRQLETIAKKMYAKQVLDDPRLQYAVRVLNSNIKVLDYAHEVRMSFPNQSRYENLGGLSDIDIIFGFDPEFFIFDSLVSKVDRDALTNLILRIAKSNPATGLLTETAFSQTLATELGNPDAAMDFGMANKLFEISNGFVIPARTGIAELAELALASKGESMTFEQLSTTVLNGRSEKSFRNVLFSDPRFKRTSLSEWALSSWEVDEYTNIKDEISEVLDDVGEIRLDELSALLSSKYGVSSHSVVAYSTGWPFQTIGGVVSRADSANVSFGRPLSTQKDIFNIDGRLMIRLKFGTEQERGSGTSVSKAAAAFLGVGHGDSREYTFERLGVRIRFGYKGLQPTLGSVRDLAVAVGAERGDHLYVVIGSQSEIFKRPNEHALKLSDIEEFFGRTVSSLAKQDIRRVFATLLSLDESETFPTIFSALRNRGESELESELRALVGDNQAFDLEITLKSESKFKISQIDDV